MRIAIIGTRGIPNQYGGFEQFAEHLSVGLVKKGHEVFVYNSHRHSYQESTWFGVNIIHCYDPEYTVGTMGQFIYDLNCTLDARKRNFDILFFLGYTSSSVWGKLYPKKCLIISNMDGLEWKRTKYSKRVQQFLLYAEKLAIKYSHFLIADSIGIQKYLRRKYKVDSNYIPYGANVFKDPDPSILGKYNLIAFEYNMLMARMEPENNIEMILDGFSLAETKDVFIVVGNTDNKYGNYIKQKFSNNKNILFFGAIYDQSDVNNLRYYSRMYFHGHSVGGTNPSLLEAMSSSALIAAHDNIFNKSILNNNAFYFTDEQEVKELIECDCEDKRKEMICKNIISIDTDYNWDKIISDYENYFIKCYSKFSI